MTVKNELNSAPGVHNRRTGLILLLKKGGWSLLILLVFLVGRAIPLPGFNGARLVSQSSTTQLITLLTGADLNQLSLLSMGVGPWMMAMIIMMVVARSRRVNLTKHPARVTNQLQFGLMFLFALLQAIVTANQLPLTDPSPVLLVAEVLILITGAFFVYWLSVMNAHYGIGGPMFLVLASMFGPLTTELGQSAHRVMPINNGWWLAGGLVALVALTWGSVLFDRAERRLPLEHVLMAARYGQSAYLPIKLAPAGGMPLMFATAFMALPLDACQMVRQFWPASRWAQWGIVHLQLTSGWGAALYCLIIYLLALLFALINVDPERRATDLQKQGDYFPGYLPGKPTKRYLQHEVLVVGTPGALLLTLIAGGPTFLGAWHASLVGIATFPGILLIIISFGLTMVDQVRTLLAQDRYQSLLKF